MRGVGGLGYLSRMSRYADDLELAHLLADTADTISLTRFRALDLRVTTKPDLTPVSDADTAVEQAIRAVLAERRPEDDILGEEFGATGDPATGDPTASGSAGRRWVIDPIDGTKNFVRGVPVWATLIALMEHGQPVVGLVSAPALGRRWWAATGDGAFAGAHRRGAMPIRVSGVIDLADASFCYSSLNGWETLGRLDAMLDLMRRTWRQRAYGDFYGYMLLAEGAVDIMVEPELSLWDLAALIPIVVEAGGTFTGLDGRPGPAGTSAIAANRALHDQVIHRLGVETDMTT
jgi:histidinol-phosphatase